VVEITTIKDAQYIHKKKPTFLVFKEVHFMMA